MADTEFDCFTRAELMDLLKFNQSELNNGKVKAEPSGETEQKAAGELKALLETNITNIKAALKATMAVAVPAPPIAEPPIVPAPNYDEQVVKTMRENAIVQNLYEVVRSVQKLNVGDDIERFVSELDQIYKVEVQPQLGQISSLENEFVRTAKRLLTFSMYEQMDKSGAKIDKWLEMKKYLIENHGSKITMFQHLNRLWRLEPKPEEKLTDYGARVEEQIHKASLHIMKKFGKDHKENDNTSKDMTAEDVFKLIGAMLVSLQVQKEHEFIYRAMIKSMDKHWSAGSLLADAQDYVDRLGSSNNATKTDAEVAFHSNANRNKSSHQKKASHKSSDESTKILKDNQKKIEAIEKAIQSLTLTKKSAQTGERSGDFTSISKEEIKKIIKAGKRLPKDQQICISFLKGNCKGKCKDGRKHEREYKVYMARHEDVVEDVQTDADLDALFQ